jgi:hypothetical protein
VRRPTALRLHRYSRKQLRLGEYLDAPGDGRLRPRIPASALLWSLLIMKVLRSPSLYGTEMMVRLAHAKLGVKTGFGDDALAYFLERLDPARTREALTGVLRRAKRGKVFERTPRIGLALDGTGVGHSVEAHCPLCHRYSKPEQAPSHGHKAALISVVGSEIVLPFDAEPYGPEESELGASKRLLRRAVEALGPRFADYVVVDGLYDGAPFLQLVRELGLHLVVALKDNMPELLEHAHARFQNQPPSGSFPYRGERVEYWDAEDVEASSTLPYASVRVLRYRQYGMGRNGQPAVLEAYWLTSFSKRRLGSRALFLACKSRWQIENQDFNVAKNCYGLAHIPHHEPNSIRLHLLLSCLALCIERLYRQRYLHRGTHPVLSAITLYRLLWLNLGGPNHPDTS